MPDLRTRLSGLAQELGKFGAIGAIAFVVDVEYYNQLRIRGGSRAADLQDDRDAGRGDGGLCRQPLLDLAASLAARRPARVPDVRSRQRRRAPDPADLSRLRGVRARAEGQPRRREHRQRDRHRDRHCLPLLGVPDLGISPATTTGPDRRGAQADHHHALLSRRPAVRKR